MLKFVKSEILNSSQNIARINLDKKKNLVSASKINVGFAALRGTPQLNDRDILGFRSDCLRVEF